MPGWDTHGLPIELKVLQTLPGVLERHRCALRVLQTLPGAHDRVGHHLYEPHRCALRVLQGLCWG